MERDLNEFVERMRKAHGDRLLSVVLYGSAATGEVHRDFSDVNVLCVLERIGVAELSASEPIVKWWRDLGQPAPLLLSEEEVRTSLDSFPMEFYDIREQGRLLHGADLLGTIQIQRRDYRAEIERELRGKLLRLRTKAAPLMHDKLALLRLLADAASTFGVLFRHALSLAGEPRPATKRETFVQAAVCFGFPSQAFVTLMDLREEKVKTRDLDAGALLTGCLESVEAVLAAVDRAKQGESLI